jgi:hypothetical protein
LADPARASLHWQQFTPYHSHPGSQCGRASKPGALLTEIQTGCRRATTCLRGEKASGESLPPDDDWCGTTERNSLERWLFGSSISCRLLRQAFGQSPAYWRRERGTPGEVTSRTGIEECPLSDRRGKVLGFDPFELSIGTRLRVCASDTACARPLHPTGLSVRLSCQGGLIGCFARGPEIVIHHDMWQAGC